MPGETQAGPRLHLVELIPSLLRTRPNQRLTAAELTELVKSARLDAWIGKRDRAGHTESEARNQVVAEIGARRHEMQRRFPEVRWFEEPRGRVVRRQFSWITSSEEEKEAEAQAASETAEAEEFKASEPSSGEQEKSEADLYPLLATWLLSEYDIRSMRLGEARVAPGASRGTKWNHWLFPDVVGVEDLQSGWHRDIHDFARLHGAPRCRFWSFEVKKLINRANVRGYYLQAVSNSSWANYGYLVAAKIDSDDFTRDELAILTAMHGIGVIELDSEDAINSRIIVPARERSQIDWGACERLFAANQDFQNFLK